MNKVIKLLRMYSNVKAIDMAKKIGKAPGYLSELENGIKTVPIDVIASYARIFGVKSSFLMKFSEKLKQDKGMEKKIFEETIKTIARLSNV
jgi:transcriptional regulator with XRE-family HTH domain